MRNFIEKLAAWHRSCHELEQARVRLAGAEGTPPGGLHGELRAEVQRLQQVCNLALRELKSAGDAYREILQPQRNSRP